MSDEFDPRHPHEPAIPPALDDEGRCLVCLLIVRAERAEKALRLVVDAHHRTVTPSKLHDPENQDWRDCPARTCGAARAVLADAATGESRERRTDG
jgi:hypothetical protein